MRVQAPLLSMQPKRESFTREGIFHGIADSLDEQHDTIELHLQGEDYQNVTRLEAASMLGYFTQTLESGGFPWQTLEAKEGTNGKFKVGGRLAEMEALNLLEQGQPIMLQPMRDMKIDLSTNSINALGAAGSLVAGGADASKVTNFTKTTKVSGGTQGIEVKYGEPIPVSNFAELKLLYQMYKPDEEIKGEDAITKAAKQTAFFTKPSAANPWRFFIKDDSSTIRRVGGEMLRQVPRSIVSGAAVGGATGAVFAYVMSNWKVAAAFAGVGALLAGGRAAYEAIRVEGKGRGVNSVEALERIINDQPVYFQESKAAGFDLPFINKFSFYRDKGKANMISSPDELNTFYYMQSQAELPKEEEEEKEEEKPETPQTVVIDRSVHNHYYYGPTTEVVAGDKVHQHPSKTVIVQPF